MPLDGAYPRQLLSPTRVPSKIVITRPCATETKAKRRVRVLFVIVLLGRHWLTSRRFSWPIVSLVCVWSRRVSRTPAATLPPISSSPSLGKYECHRLFLFRTTHVCYVKVNGPLRQTRFCRSEIRNALVPNTRITYLRRALAPGDNQWSNSI